MTDQLETDKKTQNYEKMLENEALDKSKEELTTIQENLSEKKITVEQARAELKNEYKKIDEWIKWTNLEKKDKKEIWKAFEHLTKLERDIDETALKNEVNEIINLLETLTIKDFTSLKDNIQKNTHQIHEHANNGRPADVEKWIKESSNNLTSTIDDASQDSNVIARTIGSRMKKLMS